MAVYNPPTEDLPIFDNNVFTSGNEVLTVDVANNNYLKFPFAQGAETLTDITVLGASTFNGIANFNSGTNSIIVDPSLASSTITLTDGTTTNTLTQSDWTGTIKTVNTLANATHYLNFSDSASTGQGNPQKNGFLTCNPSTGTITAGTFSGALSGNATSSTTTTTITVTDNNGATTYFPVFTNASGVARTLNIDSVNSPLTYVPSTGTLSCPVFAGSSNAVALTPDNTAGSYYIPFSKTVASTNNTLYIDNEVVTPLTYNPSNSTLAATTFSGNLSGNATTATTASTSQNINVTATSPATTYYLNMTASSSGAILPVYGNLGLSYNSGTGALTATSFTGASASIVITDNVTNTTFYPVFTNAVGTTQLLSIDSISSPLTYNPSTAIFTTNNIALLNATSSITSFTAGVLTLDGNNVSYRNYNWVVTGAANVMGGLTVNNGRVNGTYKVAITNNGTLSLTINASGLGGNVKTKFTTNVVIPNGGFGFMTIDCITMNATTTFVVDAYVVA